MSKSIFLPEGVSYLNPLFWQRGESESVLRNEIRKMKSVGIGEFIAEARPHPDYLGDGWWRDLEILIDEAKKQNMKMWIFDDGDYPSGRANGLLEQRYPEAMKQYISCNYIDATGPQTGTYFLIGNFLEEKESVLRVVAAKRKARGMEILPDTLVDVTDCLWNGRLYWDVPGGDWRVFLIKRTPYGEEQHTAGHVNPLSKEAVRKYIDLVHEAHWAHFSEEFGKTIVGFFTDEPRFGNTTGYDRVIGHFMMPLPFTDGLLEELSSWEMGDFGRLLPCLWYDAGSLSDDARYVYMDVVSKRFSTCFIGQLSDWCHAHGVKLIGHVVEENGAHARLGYGAGHFFRSTAGLDAGGLDIVCNMLPEQTSGCYLTAFNNYDCDFNHWGLPKLASSSSHIDPQKQGRTMVEAFGAYGWVEGLKWMKWITDGLTVRGVNYFVPHAFSCADFPDNDCPPHFYAHGYNPQFRNFGVWSAYTNRVCHLISDGLHIAPVAVAYHAEAEWGGESQPFEKAVKTLAQHQIDCDVIPFDTLEDETLTQVSNHMLSVYQETYRAVVIPRMQYLPQSALKRLEKLAQSGVPVVFLDGYPERVYFGGTVAEHSFHMVQTDRLASWLWERGLFDVKVDQKEPDLCYYHYQKQGVQLYFLVNQSTQKAVDCTITFPISQSAYLYDAMLDKRYTVSQTQTADGTQVQIYLQPYESIFVVFDQVQELGSRPDPRMLKQQCLLNGAWDIAIATAEEYPRFRSTAYHELENLALPERLPEFSGTMRYTLRFDGVTAAQAILDLGQAFECVNAKLNGVDLGARICPPYQYALPENLLQEKGNLLEVEVTNTLAKSDAHRKYDRYFPQEPSGLLGPVRILY